METMVAGRPRVGATCQGDGRCQFHVWAPHCKRVDVHLMGHDDRSVPLEKDALGYHSALVVDVEPGTTYRFRLDHRRERPDPASRWQPVGVHGPSKLVDPSFGWSDRGWTGLPLADLILYELHVGTFTHEGTFEAAMERLPALRELGVTAVELMPVAAFPGGRNWGYDGVYPFAVQESYGGPAGLAGFVDAAHANGLAVVLDVVHNHLGPEGNYLSDFGPYFTDRYRTPWGRAVNFDGPGSDEVRSYFIQSALHWVDAYHMDGLRLDAVHAIHDESPLPFVEELAAAVHGRAAELGRRVHVIAESDANDVRLVRSRERGGRGLDAVWADDLHHALHAALTGERHSYYVDYGNASHIGRALRDGFAYSGQRSEYRQRRHGSDPTGIPGEHFVVCAQNHDQVGNRLRGKRLNALTTFERVKLAAATVLLSPFLPLLFMGEEHGETSPFPYFVSHGDPALLEAVRTGRAEELAKLGLDDEPLDPASEATFEAARLHWELRDQGRHGMLLELYGALIALRREIPALRDLSRDRQRVDVFEEAIAVRRVHGGSVTLLLLAFGVDPAVVALDAEAGGVGELRKRIDTADERWGGAGSGLPDVLSLPGELSLSPGQAALYEATVEEPEPWNG